MHLARTQKLTGQPWEAVRALALPVGDYVVFGSAPLLAHGLIGRVGDVDLLAVRSAWEKVCSGRAPTRAPGGDEVVRLAPGLEVFHGWLGLDVDGIVRRAEVLGGLPIAQLADVAAYKRLLSRPKDQAHLELLEAYWAKRRSE